MKNTLKRISALIIVVLLAALMLCSCGKSLEEKLIGKWYVGGDEGEFMILYDDGTCDMMGEYGTWNVVNDNLLKITFVSSWGSTDTQVVEITSLKGGCLTLTLNGVSVELYDTEEAAAKATPINLD